MKRDVRTFNLTGGYNEQGIAELPDPSTLPDGTVLIKVGGEWKVQAGYGWIGEPAFEPITWDGNTEGRVAVSYEEDGEEYPYAYKVSDNTVSVDDIVGGVTLYSSGVKYVSSPSDIQEGTNCYSFPGGIVAFADNAETADGNLVVEKGIYFEAGDDGFVTSLTASSPYHTIDANLIPKDGIMETQAYDPTGEVKAAGGIVAYINSRI